MSFNEPKVFDIGELVDVTQGLAINAKTKHLFRENGLPLLRITDMFSDKYSQFISIEDAPKQCIASKEELIYTRTGQVGFVFTNKVGVVHNNCFKVTPKDNRISRRYLYWFLRQNSVHEYVNTVASGSVQKDLNHSAFKTLKIPLPSIEIQNAIDSILSPIDDRITLLRETNATLEAIAQALFKSWFVDFDPVRAKMEGRAPEGMDEATAALFPDSFEESELGVVPRGWRVGTLADLMRLHKGSVNPGAHPDTEFQHFSLPAFDAGQLPIVEHGSTIKSNKTSVPTDAVLLSKLNPHIPRIWLPSEVGKHAVCSTEFLPYLPSPGYTTAFVYCLLSAPDFSHQLCQLVTGTSNSHQRIKPESVLTLSSVVPPSAVISTFDDVVSCMLRRVKANRIEMQTLSTLRDTLLPRLISGQLRLPEANQQAEEALA